MTEREVRIVAKEEEEQEEDGGEGERGVNFSVITKVEENDIAVTSYGGRGKGDEATGEDVEEERKLKENEEDENRKKRRN